MRKIYFFFIKTALFQSFSYKIPNSCDWGRNDLHSADVWFCFLGCYRRCILYSTHIQHCTQIFIVIEVKRGPAIHSLTPAPRRRSDPEFAKWINEADNTVDDEFDGELISQFWESRDDFVWKCCGICSDSPKNSIYSTHEFSL